MGGVSDFLFGSDSKTSQTDPYRPESDYEREARGKITKLLQGMFGQGTGYLTDAAKRASDMATNYSPEEATMRQGVLIKDWTDKQTGGLLNNMAQRNIINSQVTQNSMGEIGTDANKMLLNAYDDNINRAAQLNGQVYQMGHGLFSPYVDQYNKWLNWRAATPQQTVQEQGSPGLLGSLVGGVGTSAGKKWFD